MSSLINKAKDAARDALSKDKSNDTRSDNYGSHQHDTMNQADPRIDSDMDHRNNPTSTYGSNTSGGQYTGTTATGSTNEGPYRSNLANKLDPRVDSDRDHRNDPTSRVGGHGTQEGYGAQGSNPMPGHGTHSQTGYAGTSTHPQQTGYGDNTMQPQSGYGDSRMQPQTGYGDSGMHSQSGYGGNTMQPQTDYGGHASSNAGPHGSNFANKLDPHVDSDMDNRNDPTSRVGGYGTQDTYGTSGTHTAPHGQSVHDQTTSHQSGFGGNTSSNAGPHNSNMMNKLDPRVDSDMDNRNDPTSRTGGYGTQQGYGAQGSNPMPQSGHSTHPHQHQHQQTGYAGNTGTQGYGESGLQQGGYGGDHRNSATPGSGNADKTAGPWNSNLMNKIDPRVDSDLDGSKTYGGNKTSY